MTKKRKNYLLRLLTNNGFVVLRLPSHEEIIKQNRSQTVVLNFDVEELLSRDEIEVNQVNFEEFIEKKSILITGGAGSIGSEITLQLSKYKNCHITVVDFSELNLYNSIKFHQGNNNIEFLLLDITNYDLLESLFKSTKFDIIYNAAAYKHVPIFEDNSFFAFKNNIIGCKNIIDLALKHKVEKFILVSSDKAVNPTNLMGVSKRVCEILCHLVKKGIDSIYYNTFRKCFRFKWLCSSNL